MGNEQDFLGSAISKMIKDIEAKKHEILEKRFFEKTDLELKQACNPKARFKRMIKEVHEDYLYNFRPCTCEKWYYDDSSIEGILIVSFFLVSSGEGFSIELFYE